MRAEIHRLYIGTVMHRRVQPFVHQFRYAVHAVLLDLDRLEHGLPSWLRRGRFGLFSFADCDHGPRNGAALRPWVDAQHDQAGLKRPARVQLLCFPRFLGFVFNPLSIYFCFDSDNRLSSLIYEVKNTFGDQHPYVLQAEPDSDGTVRHGQDKHFYVSPFLPMGLRYEFVVRPPDARLSVMIREYAIRPDTAAGLSLGPSLFATWTGETRAFTNLGLLWLAVRQPLMVLKVVAAIHWQALRLWLKGAKFHRYPGADRVVQRQGGHG